MANAFDQFDSQSDTAVAQLDPAPNPFDAYDPPPDVTKPPDLPPEGGSLPPQYKDSIPADNVPIISANGATKSQLEAIHGAMQAQQAIRLLTDPLYANWPKRNVFQPTSAAQTDAADAKTAEATAGPLVGPALDSVKAAADYVAPGFLDQVDASLGQFQIPQSAARQFISDAGNQFGGSGIESLLPKPVQRASAGLADAAAEQVSSLTSPDNIKILGGLAILPEAGPAAIIQRALSLGFGAQAAVGMTQAISQATHETDPQEFWKQVGNAVGQAAIATLATRHGLRAEPTEPIKSPAVKSVPDTVKAEDAGNGTLGALDQSQTPAARPDTVSAAGTSPETPLPSTVIQESVPTQLPVEVPQPEPTILATEPQVLPARPAEETPQAVQEPSSASALVPEEPIEPKVTSTKNAATDAERVARDIAPAVESASRDFGTVWDEATAEAARSPDAPRQLVETLKDNPRPVSDKENALLLRRQIEVQNEHDAAIRAVNENPGDVEAQARLDRAREAVQTSYDVARATGTETGRGLNARKMLAANDFSLAKMEAETRAVVNKGKPLSEDQAAQVKALHDRIAAAEAKVAAFEARDQFNAELKAAKAEARKTGGFQRQSFFDRQEAKALERIKSRRGRLNVGIDPTALVDEAIVGAAHIARGVTKFSDWSAKMLEQFGERIKPHLQALFERARQLHSEAAKTVRKPGPLDEEVRLHLVKQRVATQTEKIRSKLESGDFSKTVRTPVRPDRELLQLRGELQRAKDEYALGLEKGRRANMTPAQRAADTFVRAERAIKLTGITTFGKLAGAGATRLMTSPIEEAVGSILGKLPIIRKIAAEAPREGGTNLRAEGRSLTSGMARGVRNIPTILKGERTNEEAVYGKHTGYNTGSFLDIPGRAHGAIKSAFKEAERERSTIKRQEFAKRKGLDPTEAATEQEIGQAAHLDAQRAIFMQDNLLSDVFRGGVRMLENSKKFPTSGFYLAKVANFLLPIVKVPTNVALETATHLTGWATASGKLMQVMSRGLKTVKPEEADMIMRHYKKGAVGAALFFTGYFNSKNFGGFYQKGDKRKPDDVRWGGARIAGVNIPSWLLHAPAFIALQAGSTAYRVTHAKVKGKEKGHSAGVMAVADGMAHEIPFINEMGRIDQLLADGYEGTRARGNLLSGSVVPQGLKNFAEWTDEHDEQGNPVRRSPKTALDYVKFGIPGLREQVPLHDAMEKRRRDRMRDHLLNR